MQSLINNASTNWLPAKKPLRAPGAEITLSAFFV
jgi:hypothetical protein